MLPAYGISRLLALFAHEPAAAATAAAAAAAAPAAAPLHSSDTVDEPRGGAGEGAVGASVLGALCEIRLTDYLRVSARSKPSKASCSSTSCRMWLGGGSARKVYALPSPHVA